MKTTTLLSLVIATSLLPVPSALAQRAGQNTNSLTNFQNALEHDGFDVRTGAIVVWDPAADYCAGAIDSAGYFSNEKYLQVRIPTLAQPPELSRDFQQDPDEAIVLIGLTPPPARYFSYTPYLDWKMFPGGRKNVLASFGDAVNNATVKTIGSSPFNALVVLIFTPDQGTDTRVRAALRKAGYPAAIINTVVLPVSLLRLGHNETADQLVIGMRTALWDKQSDGDFYIAHPPISVFRVTPRTPTTANPFPTPPLRVRGTGQTEMALLNKLDELREGIIAANPGLYAKDIVLNPMCNEGCDLIQRGIELCGDSRDALYLAAGFPEWDPMTSRITLADDEFLMVYGANHVATGKATYMNINVYATETAKLTLGNIDDRHFTTAAPYLPAGDPAANSMYAYKISRSGVAEPNCLLLSVPQGCTRLTLDSSTLLGVFIRIYLEPATKVGPAMPEILYDRIIKFSPRQ